MKYSIFLSLIFMLTLPNRSVNGDVLLNTRNFIQKIRNDVKNSIYKDNSEVGEERKNTMMVNLENINPFPLDDTNESTTTSNLNIVQSTSEALAETQITSTSATQAEKETNVISEINEMTSTTAATRKVNETIEKDGRENFTGGCSTGYRRTADGRCKPTF